MKNITAWIAKLINWLDDKQKKVIKDIIIKVQDIYEKRNEVRWLIDSIEINSYDDIIKIPNMIENALNEIIVNESLWNFVLLLKKYEWNEKKEVLKLKTCLRKLNRFKIYWWLYNKIFDEFWEIDSKEKAFELLDKLEKEDEKLSKISRERSMYEIFWIDMNDIWKSKEVQILESLYKRETLWWDEQENEYEAAEKAKEQAIEDASKWNTIQANLLKNISDFLDVILSDATKRWWSDIHIEPKQVDLGNRKTDLYIRVRFRLNWDLIDQPQFSFYSSKIPYSALRNLILSRSWMNMDQVRNVPLDWKFTYFYSDEESWVIDKKLEIRVATVPILWSQWIVMRILGWFDIPDLRSIWLITENSTYFYDQYMLWLKKSQGMILVTWPTWSGKTSTLNSTMKYITWWDKESLITWNKRQDIKCITCEDPIEIELKTTMQSAVESQDFSEEGTQKMTFESFSRSSLRLDPDVCLIGELRNKSTVDTAIKISITWHLLLWTLHTSSCASTITRIIWESWIWVLESLVDSLNMILAQRLVKIPCKHCSVNRKMNDKEVTIIEKILKQCNKDTLIRMWLLNILWSTSDDIFSWLKNIEIKRKNMNWCEHCWFTWSKWRAPLFEIMIFDRKLKRALLEFWQSALKIEEFAVKECWMPLLVHWWIINMLEWKVTYEELDDLVNLEVSAS